MHEPLEQANKRTQVPNMTWCMW